MNPTSQDLPSASYAFLPLITLDSLPTNSAVSPFHAPYTVSPILINFTNPDGKSGLWQAGRHHEVSSKLRLSAIGFLYPFPIISWIATGRCMRESDWGNDSFRHGTTSPCLVSRRGIRVYRITRHQISRTATVHRSHCIHAAFSTFPPSKQPVFVGAEEICLVQRELIETCC